MRLVQNGKHSTAPAHTHVQPQTYRFLLHMMHCSGLLAWQHEDMRLTTHSNYADHICMMVFAISKDMQQQWLISSPCQANTPETNTPMFDFPRQNHFGYIRSTTKKWSWLMLDDSNMFHNLPVTQTGRELFFLEVTAYKWCSSTR